MDLLTEHVNREEADSSSLESPEARIGERVHRLRRAKGLTRTELGERLGVSRQRVGNWERGLNTPALGMLLGLARELGVTVDELITGEPAPRAWLNREQREEAERLLERLRSLLR